MTSTKFNQERAIYNALIDPIRISALKDCDHNLISYNPNSFLMIFRFRGRHFRMILLPLLALQLWDVLWGLLLIYFEDPLDISDYIRGMNSLITPVLTPVSFLLVFRLGRAAVRYWDARAAMGKIVEVCRTTASTALVGCQRSPNREELGDEFVRWIAVFPIAVKNFLRSWEGLRCNRAREIDVLLSSDEKQEFLDAKGHSVYAPIMVLNNIRQLTHRLAFSCDESQQHHNGVMGGVLFRQLNEQIDLLTGSWGAMERINGTPLPFIYVVHLRTFLILYLFLWHMQAIAGSGWIALLPLQLASWGLLGIEAAAVECERPFQWDSNHLALGKCCIVVAHNLAQTYENLGYIKQRKQQIKKMEEAV